MPKTMTTIYLAFTIILSQLLLPCYSKSTLQENPSHTSDFAFNLLDQSIGGKENKNIILSPFSISTALSMVLNGANGETEKAIAKTLGFSNKNMASVNTDNKSHLDSLKNVDNNTQLTIANALFINKQIKLKADFLETNKQFYGAEISSCNFSDQKTVTKINDWVSKQTKGKIPTIIDQLNGGDLMCLLNAIYFKGLWKSPFLKGDTNEENFNLVNGSNIKVKMMHKSAKFQYIENNKFQSVYLPYSDGRLGLYVFLPMNGNNITSISNDLMIADWNKLTKSFKAEQGYLGLPVLKAEYSITLNNVLSNLGMAIAFNSKANFSKITSETDTFIGRVIHKAVMEINEEGTTAAAATAVVMCTSAMPQKNVKPPFEMIVNKPYILVLADQKTNEKLFVAAIYQP